MITINNTTTDQASTDIALAIGCIDHDNPSVTSSVNIDFSTLTNDQKIVYADFFALGSGKAWVNIEYECVIGIDHITSEIVIGDTKELDYATMTVEDRAIVDAFKDLMSEILE